MVDNLAVPFVIGSSNVIAGSSMWPFVDGWPTDIVDNWVVPFVSGSSGVIAASPM